MNGADNIRQDSIPVTPLARTASAGDSGNGCVAQPSVFLFDRSRGFLPREALVDCKLEASNPVSFGSTTSGGSKKGSNEVVISETGSPRL